MSASLVNSWLYHKKVNRDDSYESIVNYLNGIFKDNKWTIRGKKFEKEVAEGKHGKLSKLVMPLKKQVWCQRFIETDKFKLRIAGKIDALDEDKNIIYDIKRVDTFSEEKYSDESTVQHLFYFYTNPKVKDFYYLVTEGVDDEVGDLHIVYKKRPPEDELEKAVLEKIVGLINFLKEEGLWKLYKKNQKTRY